MSHFQRSTFDQIVWGERHDAFLDRTSRRLLRAWFLGARDADVAQLINDKVHGLQVREAMGQLSPFRKPRLHDGEIVLGTDPDGERIIIPRRWLGSGLLIVSNTGGGKTNLICFLAGQVAASRCRVWLVDMYKSQFRHLRRILWKLGIHLIVLRTRDWRFNLLQAGRTEPRLHLTMVVDLLVRILGLPPRARTILVRACHELYQRFGIWNGRTDAWPCLFDLYEWTLATKGLNPPAREAILDRLGSALLALTWQCAAFRRAWTAEDLSRHSIVFEMRGASEVATQLRLEPVLFGLFLHEVERGVVNQPMDLFVMFDDAHRFFDIAFQTGDGEVRPIVELLGLIRGTAKGAGIAVQTTQALSRRLVPNLATKIVGRLGCHEDFNALGADLGLTPEQLDLVRLRLQPGMFVGQVAEGDHRDPFLFRVPLLDIATTVDDAEAAESVRALDAIPTVPAPEFAHWQPRHVTDVASVTPPTREPLSEVERRFLEAVINAPGKPSSSYAKTARLNGATAAAVRARLVTLGYLREHPIATGHRGRMSIVLEPLDKAFAATAPDLKQE